MIYPHPHSGNTSERKELQLQNGGGGKKKTEEKSLVEYAVRHVKHPTVDTLHVAISVTRGGKHPQALPTNLRLALRTSHAAAAPVLLDPDVARWALFNVLAALGPTFQQLVLGLHIPMYLPLLTGEPVVVFLTRQANSHEARSALEDSSRIRFAGVHFGTPRSGAEPKLLRMAADMVEEGDF